MDKVTVIIPVYNVEDYLGICLDSIVSQTHTNLEILCVNDGTKDSSLNILEKYALFDKRIRIISKENGGLSSARNAGFKEAQGDYTLFIDSDDWVSPLMVERLLNKAKETNADFVYCNVIWFNTVNRKYFCVQNGVSETLEKNFPEGFFNENDVDPSVYFEIPCSAWNKIYKTEFLKKHNLEFPEGLIFEDVPFYTDIFLKAERIGFDKEKYYVYRANRGSSIIDRGDKRYFDAFTILEKSKQSFIDAGKWDKYKTHWLIHEFKTFMINLYKIQPELQEEFYDRIKRRYAGMYLYEYDSNMLQSAPIFQMFNELENRDFNHFKELLTKLEMVM